jgi:sortase (surface protein transpeptidase)
VKPEDVFILEQNYEEKTLKLVTCVPEGTYLRRGVITATLDVE